MRNFFKLALILLFLVTFSFNCNDEGTKEYLLLVLGNGGTFTGYYILINDGDSTVNWFSSELVEQSLYEYEKEIDEIDKLDVTVTRDDASTSLTIKLYRNDEEVAGKDLAASTVGTDQTAEMSLSLVYEGPSDDTGSGDETK